MAVKHKATSPRQRARAVLCYHNSTNTHARTHTRTHALYCKQTICCSSYRMCRYLSVQLRTWQDVGVCMRSSEVVVEFRHCCWTHSLSYTQLCKLHTCDTAQAHDPADQYDDDNVAEGRLPPLFPVFALPAGTTNHHGRCHATGWCSRDGYRWWH